MLPTFCPLPVLPATRNASLCGWICLTLVGTAYGQQESAPVVAATVVERMVSAEQTFVGTVVPVKTSRVGSGVEGRVVELLVEEGDAVKKDQPLAQLRTRTLEIELSVADAELALRRESLAELENGSRPEEIAQSQARMLGAKSMMEYSKATHRRTESLFGQGRTASEDQLHEALSAAVRDEQSYNQAKAFYEMTVRGPRPEQIAQAKARVASQLQRVELIKDQIAMHTIRVPFDGFVVSEETEVGQWLEQGQAVAEIVQLREVDIQVYVLGKHVAFLKLGTAARVEVPALPNETFSGLVELVVPRAEARSRTFPVKIRVQNEQREAGPLLKAGMLARVGLPIGDRQRMTLVPKDALVLGGRRPVVFVVDENSKQSGSAVVRSVPVGLGVADGEMIQVSGSLKPGERVVVRGNERLTHGQQISVVRGLPQDVSE